jgi:hypothetical protein
MVERIAKLTAVYLIFTVFKSSLGCIRSQLSLALGGSECKL